MKRGSQVRFERLGQGSVVGLWLSAALLAGCQFHARSAEDYRKATRQLLETRSSHVKACYDTQLQNDPTVSGRVVVKFKVEADTGRIVEPRVAPSKTTAPDSLSRCVVEAIDGLVLDPPDARTGDAEYSWEFKINKG